jgi:threonine synthase
MNLIDQGALSFRELIDSDCEPQKSIVMRYLKAFKFGTTPDEDSSFKDWLRKTSIEEGSRIFPLLTYRDVSISVLDETSFMHTKTLKSIDGCITMGYCKSRGYDKVVFESGGNTGTAFTRYGQKSGLETFFFLPEDNLSLLESEVFKHPKSHLISVKNPGMVKEAVSEFARLKNIRHIPEKSWRYQASMFRGAFILEYMLQEDKFDWLIQTISAAFGPIGIYRVFYHYAHELGELPKFLGIQQEMNCPMYRAWKKQETEVQPEHVSSTEQFLTRVMYDVRPRSYGTYGSLYDLLTENEGDLSTINHDEYRNFMAQRFNGKGILEILRERGIEITTNAKEVVEKTGLLALAGTIKAIDQGRIPKGKKVLCCLTSGVSKADGQAKPEHRITLLNPDLKEYINTL